MNLWMITYFILFALLAGSAFAMMWANIQSINVQMNRPPKPKHPEAPEPGDEVMYVDVSKMNNREFQHKKEWLENLYNESQE